MSFNQSLLTLSLLAAFSVYAPNALAEKGFYDKPYSESEEFDEDIDDSLEDFYGDEDFVSIATGSKKLISKAPSVASVVTSSDIEEMGARTLSEVLESIPGLHTSFSAEISAPKLQIRGISTKYNPQTLVLIDGTPISSVVRGDRHTVWGAFPIKSIARIEVIRGPGSAIYGADAFAGVINVITKSSDDIEQTEIGVRAGSFNTKEAWFITKFNNDDVKLALTGEFAQTDGHDSVIDWDAQSNLDALNIAPPASFAPSSAQVGYKAYDLNFKMAYKDLDFKLLYQDRSNVGTGQGVAQAIDPHGKMASEKILMDVNYNVKLSDNIISFFSLSHYRSSQEVEENLWLLPPGTLFGAFPDALIGNPRWFEKTSIAKLNFNYEGWSDHKLDFGFGYRNEDLYKVEESKNFYSDLSPRGELVDVSDTNEVFMPESDRESYFLYMQGEFYLAPDWELTAGLRYDNYSDFGSTTNPRLALVWTTSQRLTTKFLYGEAFRAPAFAETTVINNPVSQGNPNLKPETINTLEVAFSYKASENFDVNLNIYKYKINDLIDFIPDDDLPTATAQNQGEVSGNGAEFEINYKLSSDLTLLANYSYQKATDKMANDDLGGAPNHQAYFRVNWKALDKLAINAQINYVGKQERNYLDSRVAVDAYINSTLTIQYKDIFPGWDVRITSNNLFDEDIREPSTGPSAVDPTVAIPNDLPQAGRTIYVDITKSF